MSGAIVHKLIAETAKGIAGAAYEELARDDDFFRYNRSQNLFIKENWPRFVEAARNTLGEMLSSSSGYSELMKAEIYEALLLDASAPNVGLKGQINLN